MTREERAVLNFRSGMRTWELEWVDIYMQWKSGQEIKKSVNDWLNRFEAEWKQGALTVNQASGYSGYEMTNSALGIDVSKKEYKDLYAPSVDAMGAEDIRTGRLQRNLLAATFRKQLIDMFEEFDRINESLDVSLKTKVNQMMNTNIFKQTMGLVDKAGRKWSPSNYATMYSRTKSTMVHTDITMASAVDIGKDVVKVSDTPTDTPICSKYVGKYFSLTGQTSGLPVLDISPPFHPNCVHILQVIGKEDINRFRKENVALDRDFKSTNFTKPQEQSISKQESWIRSNRPNLYKSKVA